jgi:hypothetical protein
VRAFQKPKILKTWLPWIEKNADPHSAEVEEAKKRLVALKR